MTELKLVSPAKAVKTLIEEQWHNRARSQGLKRGTKAYKLAEMEFFMGASAALNAVHPHQEADKIGPLVPVIWVINAMSGRPIAEDEQ